jgi:NADH-quinone oxidoreductase subunit M
LNYTVFQEVAPSLAIVVGVFGVVSILWGGLAALSQPDLKALIAYSSVAHMGYVLLGLASGHETGLQGAVLQLFTHGIISGMLFLLVGVLYDRTHNREINNYSGLWQLLPHYTGLVIIGFFAGLGLPGFASFVSELFVFLGAFQSKYLPLWLVLPAMLGLLISAAYFLITLQKMFMGPVKLANDSWKEALSKDLTTREWILLLPLAVLAFICGILPSLMSLPLAKMAGL